MILADTSVWVDHLRSRDDTLFDLLQRGKVLIHPFVFGELMLGGLSGDVLEDLRLLPRAPVADAEEVEMLIDIASLSGCGIGYVDVALLASIRRRGDALLWSHDRRLSLVAAKLSVCFSTPD